MRFFIIVFALITLASAALATSKKNFPVGTRVDDFVDVFNSQMELLDAQPVRFSKDYCIDQGRKACRFSVPGGISIVVSGDAQDGVIDLFNINYRAGVEGPAQGSQILLAIMQMAEPDLEWERIRTPMERAMKAVLVDKTTISDKVETEKVVYRFVLSPIQGPIFTATPK